MKQKIEGVMTKKEWKAIVYKDGKLDEKQVFKELHDFGIMIHEVPKVYCEVTGGLLSKHLYPAETVIAEFNERNYSKEITKDDVRDMLKNIDTLEELRSELRNYFNL